MKLNARQVETAKPKDKAYKMAEGALICETIIDQCTGEDEVAKAESEAKPVRPVLPAQDMT